MLGLQVIEDFLGEVGWLGDGLPHFVGASTGFKG